MDYGGFSGDVFWSSGRVDLIPVAPTWTWRTNGGIWSRVCRSRNIIIWLCPTSLCRLLWYGLQDSQWTSTVSIMYNESSLDVHDHVHVHDGSKSPTYRKVHFGSCTRVQFPESVLPANFFKCSGTQTLLFPFSFGFYSTFGEIATKFLLNLNGAGAILLAYRNVLTSVVSVRSGVSEFVIDDRIAIGGRSFSVAKRWSLIFVTDEELGVT